MDKYVFDLVIRLNILKLVDHLLSFDKDCILVLVQLSDPHTDSILVIEHYQSLEIIN